MTTFGLSGEIIFTRNGLSGAISLTRNGHKNKNISNHQKS